MDPSPQVVTIKSQLSLWPPFWRHPIRHVRLKRFWKRAIREQEEFDALFESPVREALRRREDEAFLCGNGTKEAP